MNTSAVNNMLHAYIYGINANFFTTFGARQTNKPAGFLIDFVLFVAKIKGYFRLNLKKATKVF